MSGQEQRLKGDETYKQCRYCGKPIREDQDSTSIGVGGDEPAPFHGKCFSKWCKEVPKRIRQATGGNEMAGQQMVMDPATGELVDEDVIRQLYTDTAIAGKALLTERCRLGEFVKISVIAQVVKVGEAMDGKGAKSHFQTIAITQVEDVKRGAI